MVDSALVVESNLISRRRIAADLQTHNLAKQVVEATSVQDALTELRGNHYGACIVGPQLQKKAARQFVTLARLVSISPQVAFIRMVAEATNEDRDLFDSQLVAPYQPEILTSAFREAIERRVTPNNVARRSGDGEVAKLSDTLQSLAVDIREIAKAITNRQLELDRVGEPTSATLSVIRQKLEHAFPERNQEGDLPLDVKSFLALTLDWMRAKVTGKEKEIAKRIVRQATPDQTLRHH